MELTHRFTVPATRAATWAAFNDIESVAGCFPGAAVTGVEGDTFTGTCKVKLGPIALVYSGSGTFLEKDEGAGRLVLEAKGKDKRGNGTAGAHVTAVLTGAGQRTDVEVVTDLAITGKPAQFGRGVMQDVSDKLLQQFVDCLEQRLAGEGVAAAEGPPPAAEPAAVAGVAGAAAGPAAESGAAPEEEAEELEEAAKPTPPREDALDLGATVLPALARAYWKQALGIVAALVVLRMIVRLLRRPGS